MKDIMLELSNKIPVYFYVLYMFLGLFGDIKIGRANANDLDDWDHKDKWYYFIGPSVMARFFR